MINAQTLTFSIIFILFTPHRTTCTTRINEPAFWNRVNWAHNLGSGLRFVRFYFFESTYYFDPKIVVNITGQTSHGRIVQESGKEKKIRWQVNQTNDRKLKPVNLVITTRR
jgi:hypothetical protein